MGLDLAMSGVPANMTVKELLKMVTEMKKTQTNETDRINNVRYKYKAIRNLKFF